MVGSPGFYGEVSTFDPSKPPPRKRRFEGDEPYLFALGNLGPDGYETKEGKGKLRETDETNDNGRSPPKPRKTKTFSRNELWKKTKGRLTTHKSRSSRGRHCECAVKILYLRQIMTAAAVSASIVGTAIAQAAVVSKEPAGGLLFKDANTLTTDNIAHAPLHMTLDKPVSQPSDATELLRYVLPKCEMPNRKDYEPVETFVGNAVQEQHEKKDDNLPLKAYKGIVDAIRFKNDPVMLQRLLLALRTAGNGSTLHLLTSSSSQHARLIHNIVRLNAFELPKTLVHTTAEQGGTEQVDYSLADAHLHLLMALVSANSVFLVPTMTALWKLLTFHLAEVSLERAQRIHAALATIMRLCPKGKMELFPIMSANAPFRMRPSLELLLYYQQCLEVVKYLPSIQGQVLELLVDKTLEMDVEIKINDGGEVTIDDEKDECVFQLDLDDKVDDKKPLPGGVSVNEMADKLDSLMLLLFQYTETCVATNASSARSLYQVFARVFENLVLITHKSKFVQFLLLHVCGLENKTLTSMVHFTLEHPPVTLYRDFAAKLINIIVDPYRATVTRQTGACYLASFVSRASFVCAETVCESVSALLRWADVYMQAVGSFSLRAADARDQCSLHSLFYTVCQSAYYIMCFRGVDAVRFYRTVTTGSPESRYAEPEHIDIGTERWDRLCGHALEPLRYCLESVRSEFLQIAKLYQLLDPNLLDHLEKADRRMASGQKRKKKVTRIITAATLEKQRLRAGVGGLGRGTNPLDSFFPFDPYLLFLSHGHVEPFYNHWGGSLREELVEEEDDGDVNIADDASAQSDTSDDAESDSDSDDDGDDDDDSFRNALTGSYIQPMSLASHATSASSRSSSMPVQGSPNVQTKREQLHDAWTNTLKRSRAPSIENGSW